MTTWHAILACTATIINLASNTRIPTTRRCLCQVVQFSSLRASGDYISFWPPHLVSTGITPTCRRFGCLNKPVLYTQNIQHVGPSGRFGDARHRHVPVLQRAVEDGADLNSTGSRDKTVTMMPTLYNFAILHGGFRRRLSVTRLSWRRCRRC